MAAVLEEHLKPWKPEKMEDETWAPVGDLRESVEDSKAQVGAGRTLGAGPMVVEEQKAPVALCPG